MTSEVETNIVAVERINEYINVDNEVRLGGVAPPEATEKEAGQ